MDNDSSRPKIYSNIIEKNFSTFIDTTIHKVIQFALNTTEIKAVIAIGSLAKKEMRNYSNINLVFLIKNNIEDLHESLKELLSKISSFSLQTNGKIIFYLNYTNDVEERIIELEIFLLDDLFQIKNLIIGSNLKIADLQNMILLNKQNSIQNALNEIIQENIEYRKDFPKIIKSLSDEFIQNFGKACFSIRKTDLYQYYLYLSNCYSIITKLDAIRHENFENLQIPVYALARLDLRKDFPFYRINIPNISIADKDIRLEYVFQFNYIMRKLNQKYNLGYTEEIEQFLKKLDKEIYFWNLRDISYLDLDHLKPGILFRSSSLSRYSDQRKLKKFFSDQNIKTIIDLRSVEEVESGPYNGLDNINYINIAIGEKGDIDYSQLKYVDENSFDIFYEMFLRYHQAEIKQIFETLALKDGAFVTHCYAGRDRTGLVVALLLELLGEHSDIISKSLIEEDYLNSGNSTSKDVFTIYTKTLDEFGGAKAFLHSIGLDDTILDKIIAKFIK